jgi:uncharacterized membrane protein YidH (DUF202 family)
MIKVTGRLAALFAIVVISLPAHAYVGPGAGLSVLGSVLALFAAVLLMIAGFVWYPVKRLMNRKKKRTTSGEPPRDDDAQPAPEPRDAQPEER